MLLFISADPALGRLDYASLSDQALMEMLIVHMDEQPKGRFQDENGHFLEITEWPGVLCTEDSVQEISFYNCRFSSERFPFELIPPRVEEFLIVFANLHGTINAALLSRSLFSFQVKNNKLHGSLHLSALPRGLEFLDVARNQLSGSLALSDLPDTLIEFLACGNQFSGGIELNDLPLAMETLDLGSNSLTGSISIVRLPEPIGCITLSDNAFEGDIRLSDQNFDGVWVNIEENSWSGTLVLPRSAAAMSLGIGGHHITAVMDEKGERHALEKRITQKKKW